jgi:quercetin dioxygenase-like cupin family protein
MQGTPPGERVFDNPISGERIVIRESGHRNGGRLLRFDLFLPAGGHVPAGHVHPQQEERFTVIEGQMRFRLGRHRILVGAGDTVVIPPGKAHWFGNPGAQVAHAQVEVRPALRMEEMFEATEALSHAGNFPGTRLPRLTALARVLLEFRHELAVPHMPDFLTRAVLAPLARLGQYRRRNTTP